MPTSTLNISTPSASTLMESDPQLYEQYMLAAVSKDETMWCTLSRTLCVDYRTQKPVNDFDSSLHFAIYLAVKGWRQLREEMGMNQFAPVSPGGMLMQLQYIANQPMPIIDEDRIQEAVQLYNRIQADISAEDAVAIVSPTWGSWVSQRRALAAARDIQRSGGTDATTKIRDLVATHEFIACVDADDADRAEFGDGIDQSDEFVERIPLGSTFRKLNDSLGGGLGKTEHIIFVAPTGAGKTVLACQLAAEVACQGRHVILISTEQHSRELEPRIVSAMSKPSSTPIPFDLIKDGGDYRTLLSENQYEVYRQIRQSLRGYLHFENWLGSGMSVMTDLDQVITSHSKRNKCPMDVVILDWIGGALITGISDPGVKRQTYLDAAHAMMLAATKYNIACISMAQATADGVNKRKITEQYIAECKTMHREACAGFGISAIRSSSEEESASYTREQHMYCFKSRKALGKSIDIARDFSYQRFDNM